MSFLLFPGYNIFDNMVSELGIGPGGLFFNVGLVLSGIVAIPFIIRLGTVFLGENVNNYLRKSAMIIAVTSSVSLSLIGCFPATPENAIVFIIHGTFAFICWIGGLIYVTIFSIMMFQAPNISKSWAFFGFGVAATFVLFLFTGLPITEWIVVFAICLWAIVNSINILRNKI